MLEEFRELVRAGILRVTPENEVLSVQEQGPANGGTEKEQQPGSREEDVALLDKQLRDWIERKRRQKTDDPRRRETPKQPPVSESTPAGLRQKVIDRLAQKILEAWDRTDQSPAGHSLREQVADRMVEEILRRWQRGSE